MEAVPRLHMLWFALKSSPEGTSFTSLKKYIAEFYQEDPDSYSKEVFALETLRNQAMHPTKDGCSIMKRYYCQLHSLQNRFPQLTERSIFTFNWKDLYQNNVNEVTDMRYEMAAVLFNIAASHTQVGASVTRGDVEGMKLACTHFQCAAWTFGELRERYGNINSGGDFMTQELLVFMQQVSYAQAQECILEKSLIDNRKPNIVAKVTAQIVMYYGAALAALLTGGDDGPIAQVIDSSVYKLWKKYVRFKISYLSCILYLYQGQHSEEQQKMGERVTLYQAAWDKLEEARKESKGLPDQKEINESLIFTADVVEGKRKNAKNENEFIYHEAVPELSTIGAVQGANLVNGISFSVTDPEVAGEDIFARLVPMKAHEASSMYSEEKAKLLRKYGAQIEDNDSELATFMSSLNLEHLNINEEKANKIPQGIVDRCAALNANKTAIPDLISAMSQLADICTDVELNLKEIASILAEEDQQEKDFQKVTGVKRTPNAHITELTREYQKYMEAHARAGESNDTLRKAMELHVNNLKILARPLQDIQQSVPKLSSELNTAEIFKEVKLIVNKVNEMKAQRSQFHADLRIGVNDDDITAKVIAHGSDEGLQALFDRELAKHERLTQLIDQNLLAQKNILQALTESYAKAAPVLKTLADVKHKRETFFSSLAASYDVYEDLLAKSAKGLEFYKKLAGNVQKLLTRFKSARDVQSEERQQRLKSVSNQYIAKSSSQSAVLPPSATSNTPKLRDYLKSKNTKASNVVAAGLSDGGNALNPNQSGQFIPPIRPNPLGSENPSQAVCSGAYYPNVGGTNAPSVAPNEPPPPYTLQHTQYYDPNSLGYTNPMYQQSQQHIAPPAYTLQASPNSQFSNLSISTSSSLAQQINYNAGVPNQPQQGFVSTANPNNCSYVPQQQNPEYAYNAQQISQMANFGLGNPQTCALPIPETIQNSQQHGVMAGGIVGTPSANNLTAVPNASDSSIQNSNLTNYLSKPVAHTMQQQQLQLQQQHLQLQQQLQQQQQQLLQQQQQQQLQQQQQQQQFQQQQQQKYEQYLPSQAAAPVNQADNTTQPLYIATGQCDISMSSVPQSLQAPYVVNPMHVTLQTPQQQQLPTSMPITVTTTAVAVDGKTGPVPAVTMSTATMAQDSPYGNSSKHPGYSYNPQTGIYEYNSGYQQSATVNKHFYGQYTSASATQQSNAVGTTDSETAHKINLATGFDSPIVSHAKSLLIATPEKKSLNNEEDRYYIAPYGYHTHCVATDVAAVPNNVNNIGAFDGAQMAQQSSQYTPGFANTQQPTSQQLQQHNSQQQQQQQQQSIYMQCGSASHANTQTTKSAAEYTSSIQQQTATPAATTEAPQTSVTQTKPRASAAIPKSNKKSSNIDLLTDINYSDADLNVPPPMLPEPVLKPEIVASPPSSEVLAPVKTAPTASTNADFKQEQLKELKKTEKHLTSLPQAPAPAAAMAASLTPTLPLQLSSPVDAPAARKSSYDNISINSDLSSLDNNFDWDSVSTRNEKLTTTNSDSTNDKHSGNYSKTSFILHPYDPFSDDKTLKYFHKEVERYEKTIESLNVKMLNGNTQLSSKWKELHDLLAKDSTKRTTSVAKLFPDKNRSLDCIPYDHARIKLQKNTDDYINAAYVKNLGPGCPNFIIAQTPQQNTVNDFWSMLWSQKARTVLCLHTSNEMLDPYWPQEINTEANFDDYWVKCVRVVALSHCVEYSLKLSMQGADAIIDLSILQIKAWTKSLPSQVIGIARNALYAHQQHCLEFNTPESPLIMNCLTGSERSEVVAIAICVILGTQSKRPILINVVDTWYRICSQRQNAIRDRATLEHSMQVVLSHAHDVLNQRGIMTSYQMKIAPQVASKEKEDVKDPLNELDPLWKLK